MVQRLVGRVVLVAIQFSQPLHLLVVGLELEEHLLPLVELVALVAVELETMILLVALGLQIRGMQVEMV
jgi:hypothetical protein